MPRHRPSPLQRVLFGEDVRSAPAPAPPLRAMVLASGSAGNCLAVQAGATTLLIDAGISGRRTQRALEGAGMGGVERVSAVLLSHAHGDHVGQLLSVMKRHPDPGAVPLFGSRSTLHRLDGPRGEPTPVVPRQPFAVGPMTVTALALSHDAPGCLGFLVRCGDRALATITDTGVLTPDAAWGIAQATTLLLEVNHDPHLLEQGRYPPHLKSRIRSRLGHLSNADAAEALLTYGTARLRTVLLGHLSAENNRPTLALSVLRVALDRCPRLAAVELIPTHRDRPTAIVPV